MGLSINLKVLIWQRFESFHSDYFNAENQYYFNLNIIIMTYSKIKNRLKMYHKLDTLMVKYHKNILLFEILNYTSVYYFKIFLNSKRLNKIVK